MKQQTTISLLIICVHVASQADCFAADPIAMKQTQSLIDELDLRDQNSNPVDLSKMRSTQRVNLIRDGLHRQGVQGRYFLQLKRDKAYFYNKKVEYSVWFEGGRIGNRKTGAQTFRDGEWKRFSAGRVAGGTEILTQLLTDDEEPAAPVPQKTGSPFEVRPNTVGKIDPSNPLAVFLPLIGQRVRIDYVLDDQEKQYCVGNVKRLRRADNFVSEVQIACDDDSIFKVALDRGPLRLKMDIEFAGRRGNQMSISNATRDIQPPARSKFTVEEIKSPGKPSRWAVRYGSPEAVDQKTEESCIFVLNPPDEKHTTSDYQVEILDSAEQPFPYRGNDELNFVVRVAVHVSRHLNAVGRVIPGGIYLGKANGRCADGREYTGAFYLDQDGYVIGDNFYLQGAPVDVRVDESKQPKDQSIRRTEFFPSLTEPEKILAEGRTDEAIIAFTKHIDGDDKVAFRALQRRAMCYEAIGEIESAIADYSTLLKKDPENIELLVTRALCHIDRENYSAARNDLQRAKSMQHHSPTIQIALGLCEQELRGIDEQADIANALRIDARSHLALLNRGKIRDHTSKASSLFGFLAEYTGKNDPKLLRDEWNRYQFAVLMSDLYSRYDGEGMRVSYDSSSSDEYNWMRSGYHEDIEQLMLQKRQPTASDKLLLKQSDTAHFDGTWHTTSLRIRGRESLQPTSPHCNVIWANDQMEVLIGEQVMMTLKTDLKREEIAGQLGQPIRWWGEIQGTLIDKQRPSAVRGWYLFEPRNEANGPDILGIKLSSNGNLSASNGNLDRYSSYKSWDFELMTVRNERSRRMHQNLEAARKVVRAELLKADLGKLQGHWLLTTVNGQPLAKPGKWEVQGNQLTKFVEINGPNPESAESTLFVWDISIDQSREPKTIDWRYLNQGRGRAGIYRLIGDELIMAVSPFGSRERPADFEPKPGQRAELLEFHRVFPSQD